MTRRSLESGVALLMLAAPVAASDTQGLLARAAAAWERRAEGHDGTRARPEAIGEAVKAYAAALESDPDNLSARVGLIRALAFLGEYATFERADRVAVFARGRAVAEEGIDRLATEFSGPTRPRWRDRAAIAALAQHLEDQPHAAGLYLIGAYHWGLWARYRGRFAAVRQGVAGRLRDYAVIALALDPLYGDAGPHRLLGRLHHEAPRVPFFTGWIDRQTAVAQLTRAVELAPDEYLGRLFWIEAILAHDPSRRQQARAALRDLVERKPRSATLIEDLDALAKARQLHERIAP